MSILLQVKKPILRVELIDLLHVASREVVATGFRWLSDPSRNENLRLENAHWEGSTVGTYRFNDCVNNVVYQRDAQKYMVDVIQSPSNSIEVVSDFIELQRQLAVIGFRADSMIEFFGGQSTQLREFGAYTNKSPENKVLRQFADYLLQNCSKIENLAISAKNHGRIGVYDGRLS